MWEKGPREEGPLTGEEEDNPQRRRRHRSCKVNQETGKGKRKIEEQGEKEQRRRWRECGGIVDVRVCPSNHQSATHSGDGTCYSRKIAH